MVIFDVAYIWATCPFISSFPCSILYFILISKCYLLPEREPVVPTYFFSFKWKNEKVEPTIRWIAILWNKYTPNTKKLLSSCLRTTAIKRKQRVGWSVGNNLI